VLKTRAVQTLRACRASVNLAERLECGRVYRRFSPARAGPQRSSPVFPAPSAFIRFHLF
jgi:hypothetical protein